MGFSITSDQLASKSQSPVTSSLPFLVSNIISQDYHLCNLHSPANVTVCCFSSTPRTFLPPCLCGCSFYCLWCLFCPFFSNIHIPLLVHSGKPDTVVTSFTKSFHLSFRQRHLSRYYSYCWNSLTVFIYLLFRFTLYKLCGQVTFYHTSAYSSPFK